jgi:hypothetical protein
MADTWGTIALNIQEYSRPTAKQLLVEKELIPDPLASTTAPQTVLINVGRTRKRRSIAGTLTKANFDSLEADKYACTARTVTFDDGFSMTAIIEELTGERKLGTDLVFYRATFLEK